MPQPQDKSSTDVQGKALAWFARLNSGDATSAEFGAFRDWIAEAAENRRAYQALESLWDDLGHMGDPRQAPRFTHVVPPRRFSRRGLLVAGAAGATAAAAAVVLALPVASDGDVHTAVGEQRPVVLADGTRVDLDADSALAIDLSPQERRVTLLRGRAFFDVAPDPARPFSVATQKGVTRARGTQFSVHLWSDEATVTVMESAVDILSGATTLRLVAGERVNYDAAGFGEKEHVAESEASAWRRGKLIFEDRPLRQVLADVNRYRSGRIVVTSSDLLELRVSGIFDMRRPEGILEAITRTLPVGSVELTRYLVLLHPA